jgi:galactan beta-1,4-galactosyltransferase
MLKPHSFSCYKERTQEVQPMKNGFAFSCGPNGGTYSLLDTDKKKITSILFLITLVVVFFQIPHSYNNTLSCPDPENCTTNTFRVSKTNTIPVATDPNKREFKPYGNAAALFVQMGAYRGGPYTFAVIGLASKPLHVYGEPRYCFLLFCYLNLLELTMQII